MFFFKNSAMSNIKESFYDLEIESINGEIFKLNEFDGMPSTINPLSLYLSHNSCMSSYCYVNPQ